MCVCVCVYQLGREVDLTSGVIPSLYRLLVLLKFTTLKITLYTIATNDITDWYMQDQKYIYIYIFF